MRIRIFVLAFASMMLVASCGPSKEVKDAMKAVEVAGKAGQAAEKNEEYRKEFEKRRDERIKKGDTLALNYKKLQEYLPASISGYQAEEPTGESMNMTGFTLSNAKRLYKNGDTRIEVELVDYIQSYDAMMGVSFWINMNLTVENDQGYSRVFNPNVPYSAGFEEYKKNGKNASVMYILGGRFWLHIEGNNQENTDLVKSIAQGMKLKELAEL